MPLPRIFSVSLAALAVASAGCSHTYIPNTDVVDSEENRAVVQFCERYRHALEDKNVGMILRMMSPNYFEDGGNTKNTDDADFDKIREFLTGDFLHTTGIRYEMRYRKISVNPTGRINVDYTYWAAWRLPGVKQDEWHHKVADNQLVLIRDGDSYKILSGM